MLLRLFSLGVTLTLGAATLAAQQAGPDVLLEAARKLAVVNGDLEGAIRQYQAVIDRFPGDRRAQAEALMRMAEAYETMGQAKSREIYQRLVRDFSDQTAVVTVARTKLGAPTTAVAVRGDRPVWKGLDVDLFGTVSPDGRYLTYVDWAKTNNLMLRDFVAGTSRALTNNVTYGQYGYADFSAISRSGDQIVFGWRPQGADHELRLMPLGGTSANSTLLVKSQGRDSLRPMAWSPDDRQIAVIAEREDRSSQVGILSVADGSLRVLKTVDWRGVSSVAYSPDGRFIAYDVSVGDTRDRSHIHVMAVDASRETTVVSDASQNTVMGWADDGHLLFASNRSGSVSLWAIPVGDGRTQGAERLVKADVGSSWSLGMSRAGTLFVWKRAGAIAVRVAPIDLESGRLDQQTVFQQFIESRGRPDWSADGRHLLFVSCGAAGGAACVISIRSTESGAVRTVPHRLGYVAFPKLSPDGRAIVTLGRDLKGRQGVNLIDPASGETTLIAPWDNATRPRDPDWSPDGRRIRYVEEQGEDLIVLERDLTPDSKPAILFRMPRKGVTLLKVSPDGQWVGSVVRDPSTQATALRVFPISGGPPRELFHAQLPEILDWQWQWTPDSRAILQDKGPQGEGRDELWLVPLEGTPRKLQIDTRHWEEGGHFQLHPNGRQLAFVAAAGEPGAEVWALENFLPARSGSR